MDKKHNRAFDRFLLWMVKRRLARWRRPKDRADRFADAVIGALKVEFARRDREYAGWEAEIRQTEAAEADRALRAAVLARFERLAAPIKGFEPGEQARLQ